MRKIQPAPYPNEMSFEKPDGEYDSEGFAAQYKSKLDRPFLFALMGEDGLPLFMGMVNQL